MSCISSYASDEMARSRKGSWIISKIDENEVDKEVDQIIDEFRRENDGKIDRIREIEHALKVCKEKLRDLLNAGEEDQEEMNLNGTRRSNPIEIGTFSTSNADVLGNLPNFLDFEKRAAMKQMFFDKIVQLGLEKQAIQDDQKMNDTTGEMNTSAIDDVVVRSEGHEFIIQPIRGGHNPCCEICMHTIWRLVQSWRRCRICGMRAHDKCADEVKRVCAGLLSSRPKFQLNLTICEEKSLAEQGYQCAECACPISFDSTTGGDGGEGGMEARLCDYSGELFCPNCHWNDRWSIPARIVHNLDATLRPVCRAVKQLLSIIDNRPLIDINESSLSLIKFHKELKRVNEIRRNFLLMKCYFVSCRTAKKLRILQYLRNHSHFVDTSVMYSMRELRELCEGKLLPELEAIHEVFRKHIEEECEICTGNGFFCELCDENNEAKNKIVFAFTENTRMCSECLAVYHRKCFEKKSMHCPRCERRRKRIESVTIDTSSENEKGSFF